MENKDIVRKDFLFEVIDLKREHGITFAQTLYLLCKLEDIEFDLLKTEDVVALYSKGLINREGGTVNTKVLFRNRETPEPEVTKTDPKQFREPKVKYVTVGRQKLVNMWDRLVPDKNKEKAEVKLVADKYFKGDVLVAKFFTIFKSLFPSKDQKANRIWNDHFGIIHTGVTLWEAPPRVVKKFEEIYFKKSIDIFLVATYMYIKDSIDTDQGKCFATKPYKFLVSHDHWFETADKALESLEIAASTPAKEPESKEETKVTPSSSYL